MNVHRTRHYRVISAATGKLNMHRLRRAAFLLVGASLLGACALPGRAPTLQLVYNPAARYHMPDRNPIIVIPGILGTRLVDDESGAMIWGAFSGGAADPAAANGARLVALPLDPRSSVLGLRGAGRADGVLDRLRVSILGLPFSLLAYAEILSTLGAGGYRDEPLANAGLDFGPGHFTCFQFAYDWRLDNVANAQRLAEFIAAKRAYVQAEYAKRFGVVDYPVKFDIVAHSMGGLIARYYLQYGSQDLPVDGSLPELTWHGAKFVERAVLVGTPNFGSADSLLDLVNGRDFGRPLLPEYPPAILGSFPSLYQLLPRSRHRTVVYDNDRDGPSIDLMDAATWEKHGWGLADPRQDEILAKLLPEQRDAAARRMIALQQLRNMLGRARSFAAALDRPAPPPPGLRQYLVVGDGEATERTLSVNRGSGALNVLERSAGDGTVLRQSVLADERMSDADWRPFVQSSLGVSGWLILNDDHIGIVRSIEFRNNVLFWLLEEPRSRLDF